LATSGHECKNKVEEIYSDPEDSVYTGDNVSRFNFSSSPFTVFS
jgi:hypothetical protein